MKIIETLKNILLKIWAWILHFFIKESKVNKKKIVKKQSFSKIKTEFKGTINRDETIENTIIAIYPGVYPKTKNMYYDFMDDFLHKIGYHK